MADNQQLIVPPQPVAPYRTGPGPVAPPTLTPCPELSKALAAARDRCKAAAKDARNPHHNYSYASADNVIATAADALDSSGLALVPVREEMRIISAANVAYYLLDRLLILTHASGEYIPLEVCGWPVIPDRGRPLDKAYAIALTSSLAYKLRDLLQMPRGTQDDMGAQNDGSAPQAEPVPNPPAPAAPPDAPAITPKQRQALADLIRQRQRPPEEVSAILAIVNCKILDQLPAHLAAWMATQITDGPSTQAQMDRIVALAEGRFTWPTITARLKERYGVERLRMLSLVQAEEVIALLTPEN